MATSTKTTGTTNNEGYIKPIISPGNYELTILGVELYSDANSDRFGDKLRLRVTTRPLDNFKGLPIDRNNPSLGNFKGQIGTINYSRWGFKTEVTPNGTSINREEEILKAIKIICDELKISTWFQEASDKYPTIYSDNEAGAPKIKDFVEYFNTSAPFKDIYFHACIYGREYLNKTYINHDLFFPRYNRELGKPFSLNADKVIKFFESEGIERLKSVITTAPVTEQKKAVEPTKTTPVEVKTVSKEESNVDFLASLNEPVKKEEPVIPKVTSQLEANFMAEKKVTVETPFTDSIMESGSDINTDGPDKMPWDN